MGRVHVVGYLSIDRVDAPSGSHRRLPGGGAFYAALAAAAAGARVALHARACADFDPEWLAAAERGGVDLSGVAAAPGATRQARLDYADGNRRRSDHHDDAAWWERTAALAPTPPQALAADDVVALAPVPAAVARATADAARAAGARIVADTSVAFAARERDALLALLGALDWFLPSLDETRLLCPGLDDDAAARALAPRGCGVLQKRGAAGALLIAGSAVSPLRLSAPPVARVVDPTGAGDAVLGAFAAALLAGADARDAARAALRMGARAVAAPGPLALGFAPRDAVGA